MASLQTYLEAAKSAILAGAYDRAVLICQHILGHYPKHVEAHCLLGEAYREKGQLDEAENVFLKVLSADPENLIARWALSVMSEERGQPQTATWQLQRAFDVSPRHAELRKELSRLLRAKPRWGTAGLGRLYLHQGLTWPAIDEFRSELEKECDRLDVRVALVEALCAAGRRHEAASVCQDILDDSPDCLKANVILGHLQLEQGDGAAASGRELLRRAEALDPENVVAGQVLSALGIPSTLSPKTVDLPPMEREEEVLSAEITCGEGVPQAPLVEDIPDESAPPVAKAAVVAAIEEAQGLGASGQRAEITPTDTRPPTPDLYAGIDAHPVQPASLTEDFEEAVSEAAPVAAGAPSEAVVESPPKTKPPKGGLWLDEFASASPGAEEKSAKDEGHRPDHEQLLAEYGDEWVSLLTEDITLDAESEARLEAALAEVKVSGNLDPGWQETSSPISAARAEQAEAQPEAFEGQSGSGFGRESAAETRTDGAEIDQTAQQLFAEAVQHQEAGRIDQAVDHYREILRVAPELAEELEGHLKLVVRHYPEHNAAHRVLGDAYMRLGRFQLAIEEYNWVLRRGKEA